MIKSIAMIRRKPGTTHEEFRDHYENVHAPLGQRHFAFARYVRNYPLRVPGLPEPPYDAIVEFWFKDRKHLEQARAFNASVDARILREDEARFMDTSQTVAYVVEEGGDLLDVPETLAAERDIQRALFELARAMDDRDWVTLGALMADDVVADLGTGPLVGRDAIIRLIRTYLDACGPTQHMLGNVCLDVDVDRGEATSRCYVNDMHLGLGSSAALTFRTLGAYDDRWRRSDGRWQLVERIKRNRGQVGSLEVFAPAP